MTYPAISLYKSRKKDVYRWMVRISPEKFEHIKIKREWLERNIFVAKLFITACLRSSYGL